MEWIKVEDRLPENGFAVLIYTPIAGIFVAIYNESSGWHVHPTPTYWAKLPDPPKED